MREYNIYLSGGMQKFGKEKFDEGDKWRKYCKSTLETCECDYKVKVCNPNDMFNFKDDPQYASEREVMNLDLHKLRQTDLVIVNFNDKWSLGTMSEIAIAYDRRIPVIGLNENNQNLHPWQLCICERIFNNIDKMLDYIQDFYLR
jgi:nucleoside 2-deoxyribosyltransferase